MTTTTEETRSALQLHDTLINLSDENLGRLAVLERLFWLMAANNANHNNQYCDFGEVREEAFWHGLRELTEASSRATEQILELTHDLYDETKGDAA